MKVDELNMNNRKLLILACSKIKKKLQERPAIEVYDGPFYRILRKSDLSNVDVRIISAKYGLIDSNFLISPYEQRMTQEVAKFLTPSVSEGVLAALHSNIYSDVLLELGKDYLDTVKIDWEKFRDKRITIDRNPIGVRLHNLKEWLKG